jgi:hypothetical protein
VDITAAQELVLDTDGAECPECGHVEGTHSDKTGCLVEQWREYCSCAFAYIGDEWVLAYGQREGWEDE